jgi:hypothetical protein
MSASRTLPVALLFAAASACGGDDTTEVVEPTVLRVTATATCTTIAPESRVVGVSSEGELWYVDAVTNRTRVLDASGTEAPAVARIDDSSFAIPWSQKSAALIVDGALWSVDGAEREFRQTPPELGTIGLLCGDPLAERGAFVSTDRGLFERLGGFWWRWTAADGSSFGAPRQLVRNDGSCAGTDGALWMVTTADELWQISPTDARVVATGVGAVTPAGPEGAAALVGDALMMGSPWHEVRFTSGTPRRIAGGGGGLWVQVGDFIYLRQDGVWRIVDGVGPGSLAMYPHAAGGAWFEYPDKVCHASLAEPLVIRGLRPYEHRIVATTNLTVSSGADSLTVERDGAAVSTVTGPGDHNLVGFDLGAAGWHELTLKAGAASRKVPYLVVDLPLRSWEVDIKPLFEQRCAGAPCHGPATTGTQVDLSTYQSWRSRAGRIRERLLRGQMPPIPPQLTPDTLAIVLDWIEGGMKP